MDGWWEVGEGAVADHLCFTFLYSIPKVNRAISVARWETGRRGGTTRIHLTAMAAVKVYADNIWLVDIATLTTWFKKKKKKK